MAVSPGSLVAVRSVLGPEARVWSAPDAFVACTDPGHERRGLLALLPERRPLALAAEDGRPGLVLGRGWLVACTRTVPLGATVVYVCGDPEVVEPRLLAHVVAAHPDLPVLVEGFSVPPTVRLACPRALPVGDVVRHAVPVAPLATAGAGLVCVREEWGPVVRDSSRFDSLLRRIDRDGPLVRHRYLAGFDAVWGLIADDVPDVPIAEGPPLDRGSAVEALREAAAAVPGAFVVRHHGRAWTVARRRLPSVRDTVVAVGPAGAGRAPDLRLGGDGYETRFGGGVFVAVERRVAERHGVRVTIREEEIGAFVEALLADLRPFSERYPSSVDFVVLVTLAWLLASLAGSARRVGRTLLFDLPFDPAETVIVGPRLVKGWVARNTGVRTRMIVPEA